MLGAIILGLLMQDPALPQWARDDPFAWERARCHPQIRGDTPLESCQFRVRQQLVAELGKKTCRRPCARPQRWKRVHAPRLTPASPSSAISRARCGDPPRRNCASRPAAAPARVRVQTAAWSGKKPAIPHATPTTACGSSCPARTEGGHRLATMAPSIRRNDLAISA